MSRWLGEIDPFLGESASMRHLAALAVRNLSSTDPILILGETGTGKGVLARWLHIQGPRAEESFVDVDCASSPSILEREIFGAQNGSVSTAIKNPPEQALLAQAHGGTMFLDEVAMLDDRLELRLFEALVARHDASRDDGEPLDVRLIMSSNRPPAALESLLDRELWRSVRPLEIPPLRERPDDIPYLAQHLLRQLAGTAAAAPPSISAQAFRRLVDHPWPGNIRELKMVLERALLLGDPREIQSEDLYFESFA